MEIWIVLGLSLGQSAVYAIVSLLNKLTQGPLRGQSATLNPTLSPRPYFDLVYQLLDVGFGVLPAMLAVYLLARTSRAGALGLDRGAPLRDLGAGCALAALIGLPGLGLYLAGHALGITATVVPTALGQYWWTVPVLVLQAVKNAVLEEVVVVGYLTTVLRERGWRTWQVLATSAVLRGTYHLYQGFGAFIGNVVMGLVFAEYFRRRGRTVPLVVAHTILDVVAFVGFALLGRWLGLPGS